MPEVDVDTKLTLLIKNGSVMDQAGYCDKCKDERVGSSCCDLTDLLPWMPDHEETDAMVMNESLNEDECANGDWVSVADDDINPSIHDHDGMDSAYHFLHPLLSFFV